MGASGEPAVPAGSRGVEQTFARAAAVLDALAGAQRLSCASPTSSGGCFLGLRFSSWAAAARNRVSISERADPILRDLDGSTGDTVSLGRHEGTFPIRALPLQPGDRSGLGVGSGNVAILAFLDDEGIERILASPAHVAAREQRGVTEAAIRRHVAGARRRAYSLVDDLTPRMTGMGMPVRGRSGQPAAAISIATISARLRPPRRQDVCGKLRQAVMLLEQALARLPRAAARLA